MNTTKTSCTEALQKPIWILKITGLWPLGKLNSIVLSKLLLNILFDVVTVSIVLQNIVIAENTRNLRLLNWMICILLPLTNFFAKTVPLWFNRDILQSILNDLNSYVFNSHNDKLNTHIQKIDRISKLIWRYFGLAMTAFVSAFSILPFIIKMQPMIPAPFTTGKYDVLYKLAHLFATSYLSVNSASVDVFYMSLIALCGAQINILEHKLISVVDETNNIVSTNSDRNIFNTTAEDILKECVVLHETVNRFVRKLSAILSFPLFLQYAYGCFIICNTILQLTILGERDSTTIIGLCGYSGIVLAQMSAYHWLGNEIIFKSDKIIEACFLSKWYNLSLRCQRYLVLLMERAKRPLSISLYDLIFVSLASLGVVLRWSYSIFALIKARYS